MLSKLFRYPSPFAEKLRNVIKDEILLKKVVSHHYQQKGVFSFDLPPHIVTVSTKPYTKTTGHTVQEDPENINAIVAEYGDRGQDLLRRSAAQGDVALLRHLIEKCDIEIDTNDAENTMSPLVLALETLHHSAARALLEYGCRPDAALTVNTLTYISNFGDYDSFLILGQCLRKAHNLSPRSSFWNANQSDWPFNSDPQVPHIHPLFVAILGDNLEALHSLLETDCDRNPIAPFAVAGGIEMLAPIHLAALLRPLHVALLLYYGADVSVRTGAKPGGDSCEGLTALHLACTAVTMPVYLYPGVRRKYSYSTDEQPAAHVTNETKTACRLACIDILVKGYGLDIDIQDFRGRTALSHCTDDKQGEDRFTVAEHLIKILHADVNKPDKEGLSCLHRAVLSSSDIRFIHLLLDHGADIEARDKYGYTPLAAAVCHGRMQCTRLLLDRGADLATSTGLGYDLLSLAAGARQYELLSALFAAAEANGKLEEILSIRSIEVGDTFPHRLLRSGDDALESYLYRLSKDSLRAIVNCKVRVGFTLFQQAVGICHADLSIVSYLIGLGADVNMKCDIKGMTPLHIASARRNEPLVKCLEEHGADANAVDEDGLTPLDYGAKSRLHLSFWPDIVTYVAKRSWDIMDC